ncbi:MAG: hypothetical protein WBM84_06605 [Sedimenticolaceae bacterium]
MRYQRLSPALRVAGLSALLSLSAPGAAAQPGPIAPPAGRTPSIWLGPKPLSAAEAGIGQRVQATDLRDINGQIHRLFERPGRAGTVVVVRDPGCPVSRRYGPRITQLATQYATAGFRFVFIYPRADLTTEQRLRDAATLAIPGIYAERGSFALAEQLGVKSTGDVFVLDAEHRLRYRGAVDDQFGIGYTQDFPTSHYLRNAMDSILHGDAVAVPATSAPGCYIDADPEQDRVFPPLPEGYILSLLVTSTL